MRISSLGVPLALCGLALFCSVTGASGAVIGNLDIANCAGGGVVVTATTIDFTLPVGGGTGCIQTGQNTNVTYAGGTLLPGVQGTILDLVAGGGLVPDFMTFVGNPLLHLDLAGIGPGVANTVCATVLDPNLPACSAVAGSPFILAPTSTGTSITLSAFGTARDGSLPTSNFIGAFTTQIAGVTPDAIRNTIATGGAINSTNSAAFVITLTGVPEPSTISMAGLGGLLVALAVMKRSRAERSRNS
jgi:hypothetical protein